MNIEKHIDRLKESLEVLDESISRDLVKRQRTIGFNTSAASADMFEIFLHKNKFIDPGFIVKHEWFKSKNKVEEKFPFDFDSKKEIISILYFIEDKRNMLCYGSPQQESIIREVIAKFNKLKKLFKERGVQIE